MCSTVLWCAAVLWLSSCPYCSRKNLVPTLQVKFRCYQHRSSTALTPTAAGSAQRPHSLLVEVKHGSVNHSQAPNVPDLSNHVHSHHHQHHVHSHPPQQQSHDHATVLVDKHSDVTFLSPLVMRKELAAATASFREDFLHGEWFRCLHATLFWNLLWYWSELDFPLYFLMSSSNVAHHRHHHPAHSPVGIARPLSSAPPAQSSQSQSHAQPSLLTSSLSQQSLNQSQANSSSRSLLTIASSRLSSRTDLTRALRIYPMTASVHAGVPMMVPVMTDGVITSHTSLVALASELHDAEVEATITQRLNLRTVSAVYEAVLLFLQQRARWAGHVPVRSHHLLRSVASVPQSQLLTLPPRGRSISSQAMPLPEQTSSSSTGVTRDETGRSVSAQPVTVAPSASTVHSTVVVEPLSLPPMAPVPSASIAEPRGAPATIATTSADTTIAVPTPTSEPVAASSTTAGAAGHPLSRLIVGSDSGSDTSSMGDHDSGHSDDSSDAEDDQGTAFTASVSAGQSTGLATVAADSTTAGTSRDSVRAVEAADVVAGLTSAIPADVAVRWLRSLFTELDQLGSSAFASPIAFAAVYRQALDMLPAPLPMSPLATFSPSEARSWLLPSDCAPSDAVLAMFDQFHCGRLATRHKRFAGASAMDEHTDETETERETSVSISVSLLSDGEESVNSSSHPHVGGPRDNKSAR